MDMGMALSLLLMVSIFAALYIFFVAEDSLNMTMGQHSIDDVRNSILERLESGGRKTKLAIIKKTTGEFLKKAVMVGLLMGILIAILSWGLLGSFSMVFLILGAAAGVFIAELAINKAYQKWREQMVGGIPVLIDFLPAFLETPSITTRSALEYSLPFCPEPLQGELTRTVNSIKRTGDAKKEIMRLEHKIQHPLARGVFYRLATTWDTSITPDLFRDLRQEVINEQDRAAARTTAAKKGLFVVVALIAILGLGLLAGYPVLMKILNSVSSGFGA